jgi:hypothetical protein
MTLILTSAKIRQFLNNDLDLDFCGNKAVSDHDLDFELYSSFFTLTLILASSGDSF